MHASSRPGIARSAGNPGSVVAPGSRHIEEFFRLFAEMPHRGSATPNEPRAARLLTRTLEAHTAADVQLQPFTVDISSGAWGVAVHGMLLVCGLALVWALGLAAAYTWHLGICPVRMGFLGTVPMPFAAACLAWCLILLGSRLVEDRAGHNIASFFIPNTDSANVVATSLPPLTPTGETLRLTEADRWKRRLEEARARGTVRIAVLMAHYDSARSLPPGETPRCLLAAAKGGMGLLPTIAYAVLCVVFAIAVILGTLSPYGAAPAGVLGRVLGYLLPILALAAMVLAAVEGVTATISSNLPFVQGMNDNLSGAAAAYGALASTLPASGPSTIREGTGVIAVFTGSEENGLRGASRFTRDVLAGAIGLFGEENVELVNLDSVSGGLLLARPGERNFSGRKIGGNPSFADAFVEWATGAIIGGTEARRALTSLQLPKCLVPRGRTGFGLAIDFEGRPLPACTDLTGVWAGLPRAYRRRLRAFSIVSRTRDTSDPLARPRDYHTESDNLDTLLLGTEPENFGTVAALALALGAWLR